MIHMPPNTKIVQHGPGLHVGDTFFSHRYDGEKFRNEPAIVEGSRLEVYKSRDGRIRVASQELSAVANCACGYLDISWLPLAAEAYHTSAKIQDYVLVDVPIVVADYPNRNMDAFTYSQLTTFRPIIGRAAYQTFIGKPVHMDHDNADPTKAKGIIFDATLVPFRGVWHVKILKGFDRTKDARLSQLVQKKDRIGHSMGALVEKTECAAPWCRFHSDGRVTCDHIRNGQGKGDVVNGHLMYEKMLDYYFVESSSVSDPAYLAAMSSEIWGVS
jgi:hypothetical protein